MEKFSDIYARAVEHKGSEAALELLLPKAASDAELKAISDDRYLAQITKRIFQAGFVWRVVEAKWPDFETVFQGFDPFTMVMQSDIDLDKIARDPRIIRHRTKVASVRDNAQFVLDIAQEHGSFGEFLASWPGESLVDLYDLLKKRGTRLGGNSGQYLLRFVGKDTWISTNDVVTALTLQGVIDKAPTSKTAQRAVQAAFNDWQQESGRQFCEISRTLACSIG